MFGIANRRLIRGEKEFNVFLQKRRKEQKDFVKKLKKLKGKDIVIE